MIRKVTKQHLKDASTRPIYKVVREEEDGSLKSLWMVGTKKSPMLIEIDGKDVPAYTLTYKPDRVISDGRYGIWCCPTLEDAIHQADVNGSNKLCKIYEVYPIGKFIETPGTWGRSGTVLYPAVIMGSKCIKVIDHRGKGVRYG